MPAGRYVRAGALVAAGPRLGDREGAGALDVRLDVAARFVVDPFLGLARAPYAVAGASLRRVPHAGADDDATERVRPYLLLALGVEGMPTRGWLPAVGICRPATPSSLMSFTTAPLTCTSVAL